MAQWAHQEKLVLKEDLQALQGRRVPKAYLAQQGLQVHLVRLVPLAALGHQGQQA